MVVQVLERVAVARAAVVVATGSVILVAAAEMAPAEAAATVAAGTVVAMMVTMMAVKVMGAASILPRAVGTGYKPVLRRYTLLDTNTSTARSALLRRLAGGLRGILQAQGSISSGSAVPCTTRQQVRVKIEIQHAP